MGILFSNEDRAAMRRGFTLIEAVIVVTLLGIVGLSFAFLSSMSQRFMTQSLNASASQGDAAFALEHIKRKLTAATAVTMPAEGAAGSQLEFTWQQSVTDPVVTSRYELNGTDLRFIPDTSGGGFEAVSQGITNILFDRALAGTVTVSVTARKTSGGDTREMRLQSNISPRGIAE